MRGSTVATAALVFVLAVSGPLALAGTAVAQDAPDDPRATPTPEADEEIADQLGDLIVHEYNYDDATNTFTMDLTWRGDAPESVTMTEMLELDSGGSTQISFKQLRLAPGERTTVKMGAEIRSGGTAAILITTTQSVDRNEALVLQDGDPSSYPDIPFDMAILFVGATAVVTAAGVFVFVFRIKRDEDHGKERIA
ncbi:hypothetical protein [Halovenus marina]|uniref:hypothetical protein n=1 Tax=Halovenus marina TaxID=3396621 RepID=UPI003F54F00E